MTTLGPVKGSLQEATTAVLDLNAVGEFLMTKTGEGPPFPWCCERDEWWRNLFAAIATVLRAKIESVG